jgi:hypothetical protein
MHLPLFHLRKPVHALTLFNHFLPELLLKLIWDHNKVMNPLVWEYGKKQRRSINGGDFVYATLLQFLSCQIRITALQNKSKENQKNHKPLRENFMEARDHFGNLLKGPNFAGFSRYEFPGIEILERLNAKFQFSADFSDLISKNFQSLVSRVGEFAAGDEKLLHFTGKSKNIRMILTKPDRVGHWFYELCIKLDNGRSFLLYFRAHLSDPAKGVTIKTQEIVKDWTTITTTLGGDGANPDAITVFDSYYLCNAGREYCNTEKKKFIAAIQRNRFEPICSHLSGVAHEKGEVAAAYYEKTKELLIKQFDPEHDSPQYV